MYRLDMWSLSARKFIQLTELIFSHYQADPYTGRVRSALITAVKADLDEVGPEVSSDSTDQVLTGDDIRRDPALSGGISYAQA